VIECADVRDWLSAETDGRLAPTEASLLQEHVAGCEPCAGRRTVLSQQRRLLAARARDTTVPARIHAQAEAILLGRPAVPAREGRFFPAWWLALRRRWFYLLPAGAVAGFLALAGLGAVFWYESHPKPERRQQPPIPARSAQNPIPPGIIASAADPAAALVALHAATVASKRGDEIASSDPALVTAWFSGRLPFAAAVPNLPGATLLSGRIVRAGVTQVACILFERDGVLISVFETAAPRQPAGDRVVLESKGFRSVSVSSGGVTRTLVAALPADEFDSLARSF